MHYHDDDDHQHDNHISKSEQKRRMLRLQEFGEELVSLSRQKLKKLELPEELFNAIVQAQEMKAHGALRRQLQYIGKLMRSVDLQAIQDHLSQTNLKTESPNRLYQQTEHWQQQLLDPELAHDKLTEFIDTFTNADAQHLRQLVRNAGKVSKSPENPAQRKLYQYILQCVQLSEE